MDNFLIDIEYDAIGNRYVANYLQGQSIRLGAANYADAVCEADTLEVAEYE